MADVTVAEQLVKAGWPDMLPSPEQLTFMERGFSTDVYGMPGTLVVRLGRTLDAGRRLAREAALLRCLTGQLPGEIPSPIWWVSPGDAVPFGALALSWMNGTTPSGSHDAPEVSDLVEFLVALHGLPAARIATALPEGADLSTRRHADAEIARAVVRSRWATADVDAFERWLEGILAALQPTDPGVVVHGDYWFGNLRVIDRRLHGVLDWEEAAIGDRAIDLGPILYLGSDVFDDAVRQYAGSLGFDPRTLAARARASCQARELSGIRACVAANDQTELQSELLKLRDHL